ncbi:MAG: ABC1 kinase family protein [Planctomycetota bacterium]|jgi:ubiquinone biosynthesis protein
MRITRLPKTIRNLRRFASILTVVAKHGFGDIVIRLNLDTSWAWFKRAVTLGKGVRDRTDDEDKLSTEERIRMMLEELGSTYIKFGQILATRPDLIPMSLIQELRKLQDDVPAFPSATARELVELELGATVDELFEHFEDEPLAAASIGQVHRARLKSGDEVVVKIQRPGLRKQIDNDLDLLMSLAEIVEERVPELRLWQPVGIVREFDKSIHQEIDFMRESHNIRKFAQNFDGDPHVYAPRVYEELTTERLLTMEFIDGVKANSQALFDRGFDRELIAKTGIRAILKQVFVDGFFHADPHPGNVFIMEGNVVCLLDFGMMGTFDQERIDELLNFLVAVLTNKPEKLVRMFHRLGLIGDTIDTGELRRDLADLMDRYLGIEIANLDVATYLQAVFDVIMRHRIQMPADLLLMGKSLATIDGIARDIYPELNPIEAIRPQILQIYFRRLADPEFHMRDTRRALEDATLLLQRLPRDMRRIVDKLSNDELTIRWSPTDEDIDKMVAQRNSASNRVAAAIALSGVAAVSSYLLISTASLVSPSGTITRTGSVLFWVGVIGFAWTALLSLGLFKGLFRSGGQ